MDKPDFEIETTDYDWTGNTAKLLRGGDEVCSVEVDQSGEVDICFEVNVYHGVEDVSVYIMREEWKRIVEFVAREHVREYRPLIDPEEKAEGEQ